MTITLIKHYIAICTPDNVQIYTFFYSLNNEGECTQCSHSMDDFSSYLAIHVF